MNTNNFEMGLSEKITYSCTTVNEINSVFFDLDCGTESKLISISTKLLVANKTQIQQAVQNITFEFFLFLFLECQTSTAFPIRR